jgi:hypothetical protein
MKTLSSGTFQLEAAEGDTVSSLKAQISTEKGFPIELQKLIYSGKVLDDARTVQSLNFKDKDFIVVMVGKVSLLALLSIHTQTCYAAQGHAGSFNFASLHFNSSVGSSCCF